MDTKTSTMRIFAMAQQMSAVKRYSRDKLIDSESLLEHVGFVCLFATMIGKNVVAQGGVVRFDELLQRCVLHDVEETVLGDVSRTTKHYDAAMAEKFKSVETDTIMALERWHDLPLYAQWAYAKDETVEGEILRLADLASVAYKVWTEVVLYGNNSFLRVAAETVKYIELAQQTNFSIDYLNDVLENLYRVVCGIIHGDPRVRENEAQAFFFNHTAADLKEKDPLDDDFPF